MGGWEERPRHRHHLSKAVGRHSAQHVPAAPGNAVAAPPVPTLFLPTRHNATQLESRCGLTDPLPHCRAQRNVPLSLSVEEMMQHQYTRKAV